MTDRTVRRGRQHELDALAPDPAMERLARHVPGDGSDADRAAALKLIGDLQRHNERQRRTLLKRLTASPKSNAKDRPKGIAKRRKAEKRRRRSRARNR